MTRINYIIGCTGYLLLIALACMTLTCCNNETQNNKVEKEQGADSINSSYYKKRDLNKPFGTEPTPEEQHMLRLIDSVSMVKDSINATIAYMNDTLELEGLPRDQVDNCSRTYNVLAGMKTKLDLTLDQSRLQMLKTDSDKLEAIIKKYDTKVERLDRMSVRLASLSRFLRTSLDVFMIAASRGIIVPPRTALPSKAF